MTPREQAAALREQGLSCAAIAQRLGVAVPTVYRWLNPERAERDRARARAWKDAHREQNRERDRLRGRERKDPCPRCGALKKPDASTCRACYEADAEVRRDRIAAMWAGGMSILAIARELGCTKGALTVEMARMRELGRDLPYRYRNTKRQRAAA